VALCFEEFMNHFGTVVSLQGNQGQIGSILLDKVGITSVKRSLLETLSQSQLQLAGIQARIPSHRDPGNSLTARQRIQVQLDVSS
jgi:hypothetical protein